jgi:hypothetical protein
MKQNPNGSVLALNSAVNPPAHGAVGLYTASGALRISFGADALKTLYAADGSIRVVFSLDGNLAPGTGLYAPDGRMRVCEVGSAPGLFANPGIYGKDGSLKVG